MMSIWGKNERDGQKVLIETTAPNPVFMRNYVEKSVPVPPFAEGYGLTVNEFIDCIFKGREPSLTGHDARAVLEACLAAYKSIETRAPVELPLTSDVDVAQVLKSLR
jgi:predicted dehydrogenase